MAVGPAPSAADYLRAFDVIEAAWQSSMPWDDGQEGEIDGPAGVWRVERPWVIEKVSAELEGHNVRLLADHPPSVAIRMVLLDRVFGAGASGRDGVRQGSPVGRPITPENPFPDAVWAAA